ncbi:MAG: carbon-phosphorus lyase complex subunit PhnI [Pseudomonadota bacterium]
MDTDQIASWPAQAVVLILAACTTLLRLGASRPIATGAMECGRRVSITFKDVPGGQALGPTSDIKHRPIHCAEVAPRQRPYVADQPGREGLLRPEPADDMAPPDLARAPLEPCANHPLHLQAVANEGFLLGVAYATRHSYGWPPDACERKLISTSPVSRAPRWREHGEDFLGAPAQDEKSMCSHADNIQATGVLGHVELPHHGDVQPKVELTHRLRSEAQAMPEAAG